MKKSALYDIPDDIPDDSWTTVRDLPDPRRFHASALLEDGRMCVMGGTTSDSASNTVACHSQGWWIPQEAVMSQRRTLCVGASLDGRLYVVGGAPYFDPSMNLFETYAGIERYPFDVIVDPEPDQDGGTDGGTADGGADSGTGSDGCGCQSTSRPGSTTFLLWMLGLALVLRGLRYPVDSATRQRPRRRLVCP